MDILSKTSIILFLLMFVSACTQEPSEPTSEKNYCTPKSRIGDVCITLSQPVFGWFDENIQCFAYPCAQNFNNGCLACKDSKVSYWTEGYCPQSGVIKKGVSETTNESDESTKSLEELDAIKDL